MEQLLNLLWLALAVPIMSLCLRSARSAQAPLAVGRPYAFVLAACLLMLVFPVVSASDDLGTPGIAIEESPFAGSSVKKTTGPISFWVGGPFAAEVVHCEFGKPEDALNGTVSDYSPTLAHQVWSPIAG